jgi:hypothetical protein
LLVAFLSSASLLAIQSHRSLRSAVF